MESILMRGLYGAIAAAILWGGTIFFRNVAKAFRGRSTKRFCVISAIVTGLLGAILLFMMIVEHEMYSNIIIFALILLLFAIILGASAGKQKEKSSDVQKSETE